MKVGNVINNLLKVALVGACIYGAVKWDLIELPGDDVTDFAERACVDEIDVRYDASTVRVYAIDETNNGYVVRASITLPKGTTAKVYCLTNAHGGVKEVTIEER